LSNTVFERYGGFASVRKVVSDFYDRVLESPDLLPYFERIDMRRLIDHQTRFIASTMGGPASYSDEHLRRIHAPMHITHDHFAELAGLLRETLEDLDYAKADVELVMREVMRREPSIVAGAGR
jgi:hemoglobin